MNKTDYHRKDKRTLWAATIIWLPVQIFLLDSSSRSRAIEFINSLLNGVLGDLIVGVVWLGGGALLIPILLLSWIKEAKKILPLAYMFGLLTAFLEAVSVHLYVNKAGSMFPPLMAFVVNLIIAFVLIGFSRIFSRLIYLMSSNE